MKLQLNRKHIHPDLYEELSFDEYLKLFEQRIPFLSTQLLFPFTNEEAFKHFSELKKISELSINNDLELKNLIQICTRILPLENVFSSIENNNLEQYQLYLIDTFITQELLFSEAESNYPLDLNLRSLQEIKKTLLDFCEEGAKIIRFSKQEEEIKEQINHHDKNLEEKLQIHETLITEQTGLNLLYPYPRELVHPKEELLQKIKICERLRLEKKDDLYIVSHFLPAEVKELSKQVKDLREKLEHEVKKRLNELCHKIAPYSIDLKSAYEQRKQRAYKYALVNTLEKYNLCLPDFIDQGLEIQEGHLPCLEKVNLENYVPLNLSMTTKGVHVLFGANMAGKTSVLKTLYFFLTLIQMGLPVPARSIKLCYPQSVDLHLKNSGKIRQKLSGFADELNFFCKKFKSGSYLLIDELFHSTNPLAGLELSKIFLNHFAQQDVLLFCTSFYPEVLYLPDIHFYKMLDASLDLEIERPVEEILSQTPFRLEKLKKKDIGKSFWESQQPLKLALHFPLDDELKKNILAAIKD